MYPAQPNGAEGATINPAALSSSDLNRGMKRSRSPEYPIQTGTIADDEKPRKRGRPMKNRPSGSLDDSQHGLAPMQTPVPLPQAMPPQTPQSQTMPLPLQSPQQFAPPSATPSHASPPPPKPTPKSTLKALPTVRDHTTDQLVPGGDEYIPRETDEAGEKKVMPNGQLTGGREYKCRTFLVPNRGEKLFMLATECARVLGYRDSYLLFNKNRSLFKIIASQVEKDDLVNQDVLPFSYRSRQIAIVTARSMFRQFGSRVIMNGRRVRDDYWEGKARKQGFTEADLAGEKRPGGGKAREAQEAAQAAHNAALMGPPQGEIVYSNTGHYGGAPQAPLIQPEYTDTRSRDYSSNVLKAPRQEITGPPYQDRIQPSPIPELHAQAHHAADFNRGINQQREMRTNFLQDVYRRPHEQPPSLTNVLGQSVGSSDTSLPPTSRSSHQNNATTSGLQQPHQTASTQSNQGSLASQSPQLMMTAAPYSQPLTSQSQIQPRLGSSGSLQSSGQAYNYQQSNSSWPQTPQTPQYSYSHPGQTQQSPHQQQQSQQTSSSQQQLRQQPSTQQNSTMPYSGMPGMAQGYTTGAMNHGLPYDQTPRQYMHQTAAAAPAVTQSWSSQPQASWQGWAGQPQ